MSEEEKIAIINKATEQNLTLEYIEEGAREYGITTNEMLNLMLEDITQNKGEL